MSATPLAQAHATASPRLPRVLRLVLVLLLLWPLPQHARSAEPGPPVATGETPSVPDVAFGGELDVSSRSVWRGIDYGAGAYPYLSLYMAAYHTTFTLGYSSSLTGSPGRGGRNGLDLTLSYKWERGPWAIEPSFYYYLYLGAATSPPSAELAVKLSWREGGITIFTDQICDVYNFAGSYFGDIGVTYSRPLSPRLSGKATAWLGWANATFNQANIGVARSVLNTLGLDVSLTWNLTNAIYLRPHAAYNYTIDPRLRQHIPAHVFNAGLAVGFTF